MGNRITVRVHLLLAAAALAAAALIGPATAGAATVVNGDFESGNLSGWTQVNIPSGEAQSGEWIAYSAASGPPFAPAPPQGTTAALSVQSFVGTHLLYQDVTLEPYYSHQLSLVAYYRSNNTMVTPEPNTLAAGEAEGGPPENQQYRIDVMKPTAPVESVNPADILATVFATKTDDPEEKAPTTFTADLSPFAGQTVRLRFAEVDNLGELNAGVDAVSIQSTPPPNTFSFGKPALNKKKGTAKLPVVVPGAGTLTIADVKTTKKRIKTKTLTATLAGTLNLPIKPTKSARKTLSNKGKLKLKVAVTFTPTGGLAATAARKLTLKLMPKK
jgi:hypothetical protein